MLTGVPMRRGDMGNSLNGSGGQAPLLRLQ